MAVRGRRGSEVKGRLSEEVLEAVGGDAGLPEDVGLRADLERVAAERDDDGAVLMAELAVAAAGADDREPGALEDLQHLLARQPRDAGTHAAATVTSNEVTTGWPRRSGRGWSSRYNSTA